MYLLREGASADSESLRASSKWTESEVTSSDTSIKQVYLVAGPKRTPGWLADLNLLADVQAADDDDDGLETRSLGAVVFVQRSDRIVAVTFGTGYHALDPAHIERGFGLRVAANMVAARQIRGVQTRGIASNSRDQKTLLPVDGEFSELNVEVDEDWLRQLSGKSADREFASSLSGSDSLTVSLPDFSFSLIGDKVERVLEVYASKDYEKKFPFLNQVTPVDRSDPVIPSLDALAAEQLRKQDPTVAFAAPDPFEREDPDRYELTCSYDGRFAIADLDTASVFSIIKKLNKKKSPLHDVRVYALDADGNNVDRVHPLKDYVQTEVTHDGTDFLLSAGLWFAIHKDFVKQVNAQIAAIPDLTEELDLPRWKSAELKADSSDKTSEGSYNKLVASQRGYVLLDKDLVYFGPHEKLEISDLLTPDGEMLCVKAASSSATLSHLVAQAVDSSSAWGDPKYQKMLTRAWEEIEGKDAVPLDRGDVTFVLTIATSKAGALSDNLFFFTKVQIASCLKLVTRAGFKVALAKIEMDEIEVKKVARKKKSDGDETAQEDAA
ncbi:DUF6119 family protein [Paenarthrobacter sp. AB444]|uniref:DUF6119 family protein n=1 Tax=Paenarthrobacter sp. AB444 TaxID=3025681 RepID=UPI002366274E|nr:DUF6119 family protein [Paenarthrobacter sp. AB444]MDD7833928.1 TIGR04141 family sporadically distributed protein [Paenarthrobacter sp. AB444]